MPAIRAWLAGHPDEAAAVMAENRSYIFFREAPVADPALGPVAAAKVPLTPGRSLAVDRLIHSFHLPVWIDTTLPDGDSFSRLMIAQDTGSAIVGPARGDIFFGSGDAAGDARRRHERRRPLHRAGPGRRAPREPPQAAARRRRTWRCGTTVTRSVAPLKRRKPAEPVAAEEIPEAKPAAGQAGTAAAADHGAAQAEAGAAAGALPRSTGGRSRRVNRGAVAIDARIDLHGMTQAAAHSRLSDFLCGAQASGARLVLVITGKGRNNGSGEGERGVLRRLVPIWLASPDLRPVVVGFDEAGRAPWRRRRAPGAARAARSAEAAASEQLAQLRRGGR